MIRHTTPGAVGALPVAVVEAPFGAALMAGVGGSDRPAATGRPAPRRAVGLAAVTRRADGEESVAVSAGLLAEGLVHGVGARGAVSDWTTSLNRGTTAGTGSVCRSSGRSRGSGGTTGPSPPTSESAPYAIRTHCRSPAPGLWTPPPPWTQRTRPQGAWKTAKNAVSHSAHSHHFHLHSRSTREDRCRAGRTGGCRELISFSRLLTASAQAVIEEAVLRLTPRAAGGDRHPPSLSRRRRRAELRRQRQSVARRPVRRHLDSTRGGRTPGRVGRRADGEPPPVRRTASLRVLRSNRVPFPQRPQPSFSSSFKIYTRRPVPGRAHRRMSRIDQFFATLNSLGAGGDRGGGAAADPARCGRRPASPILSRRRRRAELRRQRQSVARRPVRRHLDSTRGGRTPGRVGRRADGEPPPVRRTASLRVLRSNRVPPCPAVAAVGAPPRSPAKTEHETGIIPPCRRPPAERTPCSPRLQPRRDSRRARCRRRTLRDACDNVLIDAAAEALAAGQAVGWFQGRMEFGPRALGNRSILGRRPFAHHAEDAQPQGQAPRVLPSLRAERASRRRRGLVRARPRQPVHAADGGRKAPSGASRRPKRRKRCSASFEPD